MQLGSSARVLATVTAAAAVLVAGGCGGSQRDDIRLTVALGTVDLERLELGERRFDLRCDPPGGTVPRAAAVCFAIARDPSLLDPPEAASACAGGLGLRPGVTVRGVANGRRIDLAFRCDGPDARTRVQEFWYSAVSSGPESG
jgi:hypothetical protein